MPYASASTTGITTAVWATNGRPDSHSSTPSHQLRNPTTRPDYAIRRSPSAGRRGHYREDTCIIAGGGPAGITLGLPLARGGVDVMVMEKHADFLRDFRGDTVHASTLRLLDELGLGDDFARMPHREIDTLNMKIQGTRSHRPKPNSGFPQKHCAGSTVGPRRAAGRPAQPAAALVRAVADRRRGARHVTGGGIGINLAVADAVAAAGALAGPLRRGTVSTRQLARVQARRFGRSTR